MLVATTAEGRGAGRCWTVLFSGPRRQDGGAAGTNMVHCELGLPEAECLVADQRYSLVVQAK